MSREPDSSPRRLRGHSSLNARIPIRGLAIVLSGACLALPSTAAAGNGGAPAPAADVDAAGQVDPSFALSARHALFLGRALRIAGSDPAAAGKTVAIEARRAAGGW